MTDPTLGPLIELHRELYRSELALPRLVSRQPAVTIDPNTGERKEELATRTGMNMSGALLRRLGHPAGYGEVFPWARALWLLRHWCRHEHKARGHSGGGTRPYWRGSLCWSAVRLCVVGPDKGGYGPLSIEDAAAVLRCDRLEPILLEALRFIEGEMDAAHERAVERDRILEAHVQPVGVEARPGERHDQPGLHRVDCERCRKADAA